MRLGESSRHCYTTLLLHYQHWHSLGPRVGLNGLTHEFDNLDRSIVTAFLGFVRNI